MDAPLLKMNEVGRCSLQMNQPLCFDPYRKNHTTGAFIFIDRITNSTVGAGMIIDREANLGSLGHDYWAEGGEEAAQSKQHSQVTLDERQARFGQKPATLLLTGLTGAGKSTIAFALERRLFNSGRVACVLDGEQMRRGISKDLGFTARERSENLRRSVEVARLMNEAGLICLAAFLAPDASVRARAREAIGPERFIEIYLSAPLEVCRRRDTTGIYDRADRGEIAEFPGVSSQYDIPTEPDLTLATHELSVEACVDQIVALLEERQFFA